MRERGTNTEERNDWSGVGGAVQSARVLKPRCEMPALDDPEGFRVALGDWFERHGRDYPWRRTQDPYAILVSEVMLQQTQIGTVLGKGFYGRFMERFPTVESLAGAGDEDLLKAWEGLGYYRRARFLREAARAVVSRHGGRFPESHEELLALPGVGKYTAGAVVSFAYNRKATVVDGNVARVLSRIVNFFGAVDGPGLREIWEWAGELVDPRKPRIFNSALMELGQTLCRPGVPDCLECPVAKWCVTREPERLPVKAKKVVTTAVTEHLVFFQRQGRLLMKQPSDGRRVDMWRLPEFPEAEAWPELGRWKYGITRYRVTMVVHRPPDDWVGVPGAIWMPCEELEDRVLPPVDRKAILKLLEGG